GRRARAHLETARDRVASALGARSADVVLTAGGTEACNLGVLGLGRNADRVVTTDIEHPAVARAVERLGEAGATVVRLPVPAGVAPPPEALAAQVRPGTVVAVQWVNHETGTVLPVAEYARVCIEREALLFVDATQAFGKLAVDVASLGAHAVAVAAHKMGGPAAAGAVWVRRDLDLEPVLAGGAQERGRRPGTLDVVAQAGFGAACEALPDRLGAMARLGAWRERLEGFLRARGAVPNGAAGHRVPTVTNVSAPGWKSEVLVAALDLEGLCAASGAACSSGLAEASPVVAAMHPEEAWRAASALRLSLGPEVDEADVEHAEQVLERVLRRGPPRA
ncbi:MAG: cysteine desulfurase family protein, partial [Myxococcota bacterium]